MLSLSVKDVLYLAVLRVRIVSVPMTYESTNIGDIAPTDTIGRDHAFEKYLHG